MGKEKERKRKKKKKIHSQMSEAYMASDLGRGSKGEQISLPASVTEH